MDFEKLTSEQAHALGSQKRGKYTEIIKNLYALAPGEALVIRSDHKLATVKSPVAHLRLPAGMFQFVRLADGRILLTRRV